MSQPREIDKQLAALEKAIMERAENLAQEFKDKAERHRDHILRDAAESLHMAGLKCPKTGPVESEEDIEGAVLEKVYLCEKAVQLTHDLFKEFIRLRVSEDWDKKVVPLMRQWMRS